MTKNNSHFYRVRVLPNKTNQIEVVYNANIVFIGWPAVGDVAMLSKDQIRKKLIKNYPYLGPHALGLTVGYFERFLSMSVGDYILIPVPYTKGQVLLAKVIDTYKYQESISFKQNDSAQKYDLFKRNCTHTVPIEIVGQVSVNKLSSQLKASYDVTNTVISLDKYSSELSKLFENPQKSAPLVTTMTTTVSMMVNKRTFSYTIPTDATNDELLQFRKAIDENIQSSF